jgi:hypothetical protein
MRLRYLKYWLFTPLFALMNEPALRACTACFGKSDSTMAKGMNMGIFALLVVITTVLCGVAGFFVYLARRGSDLENARASESLSAHRTNA